jgi:group I intron endonuclease
MEKKFNFVFITTNLVNGMQYIGDHSSDNLYSSRTKNYLGSGRPYLRRAIKKYGKEKFERKILEFFPSKLEAFNAQEKYIIEYNTLTPNGYNISPKGGHFSKGSMGEETKRKIGKANSISLTGKKQSRETIEKISKSNTGKKRTEEQRKNMSKAQKIAQNKPEVSKKKKIRTKEHPPMKDKHHSKKSKDLISINNARSQYWKDKHFSKEHCDNISKSLKGNHPSANKGKTYEEIYGDEKSKEIKNKMIKTQTGKIVSQETRLKQSLASKGKSKSEEHKKNIGKSKKNIKQSEETKQKRSVSMIGKNKNKKRSPESKEKNRQAHLGKIPWNKGIPCSEESIRKQIATKNKRRESKDI